MHAKQYEASLQINSATQPSDRGARNDAKCNCPYGSLIGVWGGETALIAPRRLRNRIAPRRSRRKSLTLFSGVAFVLRAAGRPEAATVEDDSKRPLSVRSGCDRVMSSVVDCCSRPPRDRNASCVFRLRQIF